MAPRTSGACGGPSRSRSTAPSSTDHPGLGHFQRVEQAGDRVVVTGGGIIHDMRCDGTLENGVHDVAEFDKTTEIHVVASYEDGVHVLRPRGMPIEVRRWREGPHMRWQYLGYTALAGARGPRPRPTPPRSSMPEGVMTDRVATSSRRG